MAQTNNKNYEKTQKLYKSKKTFDDLATVFEYVTWFICGSFALFLIAAAGYGVGDMGEKFHSMLSAMPTAGMMLIPAGIATVLKKIGQFVLNRAINKKTQPQNNTQHINIKEVTNSYKRGIDKIIETSKNNDSTAIKNAVLNLYNMDMGIQLPKKQEANVEKRVMKYFRRAAKKLSQDQKNQLAKYFTQNGRSILER